MGKDWENTVTLLSPNIPDLQRNIQREESLVRRKLKEHHGPIVQKNVTKYYIGLKGSLKYADEKRGMKRVGKSINIFWRRNEVMYHIYKMYMIFNFCTLKMPIQFPKEKYFEINLLIINSTKLKSFIPYQWQSRVKLKFNKFTKTGDFIFVL